MSRRFVNAFLAQIKVMVNEQGDVIVDHQAVNTKKFKEAMDSIGENENTHTLIGVIKLVEQHYNTLNDDIIKYSRVA